MLKGNLLVGQSGGQTAVINSSLAGVIAEALKHEEIGEIYGMLDGVQGLLENRLIDLRRQAGTTEALQRLKWTPSSALGMCRYKLNDAEREKLLKIIEAHNIRYFMYIGGNDSADTTHRLAKMSRDDGYELHAIGIPKTIDNDLPENDHTPGYGSIARYIALATLDSGTDTQASRRVHPIKIIEVMGRNAGWVAAGAALAKRRENDPPHLIYTPERRLDLNKFLDDVKEVYAKYGYCVVVIGETVKTPEGQPIGATGEPYFVDSFGHKYYPGPANYLANLVIAELGLTARFDKPGTLQRTAVISPVDCEEAWLVGEEAVRQAVKGESDLMITLLRQTTDDGSYRATTGTTSLVNIANAERHMPPEFLNAAGNFVTPAYVEYARPLIGGDLPDYFRFDREKII
jgi:ATP-dependent phosphofructokinase / diphosphate-dependent phosphofructokinase